MGFYYFIYQPAYEVVCFSDEVSEHFHHGSEEKKSFFGKRKVTFREVIFPGKVRKVFLEV